MKTTTTRRFLALAIALLVFGSTVAGSLDPPAPPAPTMATLQQIYDALKPPGCFNNNPMGLRFVDCGNGTVQDTQTGLIWLKNANCLPAGWSDWATASRRAAKLADGTADGNACGLSDGSKAGTWRLPTQAEWQALILRSCFPSPGGPTIPDREGTGCYATGAQWASGVQSGWYWSSTPYANNPDYVWLVNLDDGIVGANVKTNADNVWPVRAGP